MTGYWDIHNHILPGVDDGSGCMRETMEMLEEEYRQGVRHIVFTPHYRRGMFAIPREEIQTVYARVCEMAADRFPEMEFYLGCEYYIHSDASVERLRGNPKYYMAGSRTVLMEFAYEIGFTKDPYSLISAGDVFVLPNNETYFDLVMIEVLSLGKIVIASRTGGNKYYEKAGAKGVFLYDTLAEAEELVDKVKAMSKEERKKLEKENRCFYEKHLTSTVFYENYKKMVNEVVD